ncbi:6-carboxytetrahydropterin synthase, partial [bacterium]|nr:6-carboxytetrahydropterin synthase [bacterium]
MYRIFKYRFNAARRCLMNGAEVHHGKTFVWSIQCSENYDQFKSKAESINSTLDNSYLNSIYLECDDESILNQLHLEFKALGPHTLNLETSFGSISFDGTYWNVHVKKRLSCAHFLPNVEEGHKCGGLHGHDFEITVSLLLAPKGSLSELVASVDEKISIFDNRLLNDIKGLENPTSEIFAKWIYYKYKSKIINILSVCVKETSTVGSTFDGSRLIELRKDFQAECAIPFNKSHSGHSYKITLGIYGEIDAHAGWSIDFSEVKAIFKEDYKKIDHQDLGKVL